MTAFRVARHDDADLLMRLERAASLAGLRHVFGPDRPYPEDDVRARWQLVLEDTAVVTLLAEDAGEAVGYAAVDDVELRHFGVVADRFGTGLADVLHAEVRRNAPGPLRLWVLEANLRARRFYERHGWAADGRSDVSEFPPHPVELGYSIAAAVGHGVEIPTLGELTKRIPTRGTVDPSPSAAEVLRGERREP